MTTGVQTPDLSDAFKMMRVNSEIFPWAEFVKAGALLPHSKGAALTGGGEFLARGLL
jgi:hypothetical protein